MANRILTALLCALAAAAFSASAAELAPALTGLSASESYAYVGNLKPGNNVTLEAWVYPTGWRDYSGREKHGLNFMYKGRIGSHIDFVFALQENGILCIGNTYGYYGVHNRRVPASKWTHVAVTINNSAGDIRFYINGVYVGQGSGWQGRNPGRQGFIRYSSEELDIGGFNQHGWGFNNDNFRGSIADVRIWNVVRSAQQIADNYKKQLSGKEPGLVAYWTFADNKDKTGHGWNLTIRGDAKCTVRKGPSLEPAAGITATMRVVNPFYRNAGEPIDFYGFGSSSTGTVSAVTFKISSLNGKTSAAVPGTLVNQGTNYTASCSWTPTRAGIYTASLVATNAKVKASFTSKPAYFAVRGSFYNTPFPIPGTIQAENFNVGPDGTEYHDTTAQNTSGAYRPSEGVDIARSGSGYVLTNTVAGEWLRYDVATSSDAARATTGSVASNRYLFTARLSAKGSGGWFSIKPEGANWSAVSVSVPDTGGWTSFRTIERVFWLPARFSALRLYMVKNGSSGQVACLDWFSLKPFVFSLASTGQKFAKSAAKGRTLAVSANTSWSAKTDASWINLRTASGSGNGSIGYDVAANKSVDRTGHITVTCAGISRVFTVTQWGTGPASLVLPSRSREFPNTAANGKELPVQANFGWTAKTDVSWIQLGTASGSGNGKVVYYVAANKSSATRTGHITVGGCGLSATFTVTQKGVAKASGVAKAAKSLRKGATNYPFAEASDGSDASAILDGDFDTAWSPADEEGCALVIAVSPDQPVFGEDVCVWGELPDETRIYGDTEDGDWILIDDDDPDASYTRIRIDIPATLGLPSIDEVTFVPCGE